ncbi:MAG: hypothetical protein ACUVUG_05130 [Candidatus Aminicenantia bacterium]
MRKIILTLSIGIVSSLFLFSQNLKIGEISFYDGSAKICKEVEGALKCEFVRFGKSIYKGDTLITSDGRVEIDFGNNDFLRVDKGSEVLFEIKENAPNLEIKKGKISLTTSTKERYSISAGGNIVEISNSGRYRLENLDIFSFFVTKGYAEVTFSNGDFAILEKGRAVEVKNGNVLRGYTATYDSFDRFVQKREKVFETVTKEYTYYLPYWRLGYPYWVYDWNWYFEPYWWYYGFWPYFYYPFYYWYPYYGGEIPPGRALQYRDILTKYGQHYRGGSPPSGSRVKPKYFTSPYHGSVSNYGNYKGSSASYHGTFSKSNISASNPSSNSHSSGGGHGQAKPKDK